jgi:hypothetical protein
MLHHGGLSSGTVFRAGACRPGRGKARSGPVFPVLKEGNQDGASLRPGRPGSENIDNQTSEAAK